VNFHFVLPKFAGEGARATRIYLNCLFLKYNYRFFAAKAVRNDFSLLSANDQRRTTNDALPKLLQKSHIALEEQL
jgi:hypothetical protein